MGIVILLKPIKANSNISLGSAPHLRLSEGIMWLVTETLLLKRERGFVI